VLAASKFGAGPGIVVLGGAVVVVGAVVIGGAVVVGAMVVVGAVAAGSVVGSAVSGRSDAALVLHPTSSRARASPNIAAHSMYVNFFIPALTFVSYIYAVEIVPLLVCLCQCKFRGERGRTALLILTMHALSSAGSAENHCANALRGLSNRSLLTTQFDRSLPAHKKASRKPRLAFKLS